MKCMCNLEEIFFYISLTQCVTDIIARHKLIRASVVVDNYTCKSPLIKVMLTSGGQLHVFVAVTVESDSLVHGILVTTKYLHIIPLRSLYIVSLTFFECCSLYN